MAEIDWAPLTDNEWHWAGAVLAVVNESLPAERLTAVFAWLATGTSLLVPTGSVCPTVRLEQAIEQAHELTRMQRMVAALVLIGLEDEINDEERHHIFTFLARPGMTAAVNRWLGFRPVAAEVPEEQLFQTIN